MSCVVGRIGRAVRRLAGGFAIVTVSSAALFSIVFHIATSGTGVVGPAFAQRGPAAGRVRGRGPQSIAPVAERLIDAVVNISTTQVQRGPKGVPLPHVPQGSPFEEFFEEFFDKPGQGANPKHKVSSLGSGFVIDGAAGLIVTNNHVIADADEIVINFHDGTKLKVEKIVGVDKKTDLALLKVSPLRPLVDVGFGRSRDMRVGDWVMAIGNPFGLGGSVTVGIISAKQRSIKSEPYDEYLQTDAAINKGNSGGPLFNMDGDVIGINTAIFSPTGGSIGIGFAVPSDTAVSVIEQLKKFGEVHRGWLGVKIQTVAEDIAPSLGARAKTGALVSAVEPSSPADTGGIRVGDVIVSFNGETVSRMRQLLQFVERAGVGKTVRVKVLRGGVATSLKVVLGRAREDRGVGARPVPGDGGGDARSGAGDTILGMKLVPIDDALRARYRLGRRIKGVVVVEIDPATVAAKRNITVGDVIVEVGQQGVFDAGDVLKSVERIRRAGRAAVLLRVEDNKGEIRFIDVPVR